uniref:Uncharacterized protein n=1 Tax=Rhizophora mucronata TaxID=61149 RepID=A0A2P2PDR3_RHIMU
MTLFYSILVHLDTLSWSSHNKSDSPDDCFSVSFLSIQLAVLYKLATSAFCWFS